MKVIGPEKEIIVPKENAVFWMDARGRWCNQHGPFKHKRIIDYFNGAVYKDAKGYHVAQRSNGVLEKVYFCYDETPLFVVALLFDAPIKMILNTRAEIELIPAQLFLRNDNLYYRFGDEFAKFNEHALLKISERLTFDGAQYFLKVGSNRIAIADEFLAK